MADSYRMTVRIELEKLWKIDKDVTQPSGERMSINEELTIPVENFLELCNILGRFQELAHRIRNENKK